jgi:hypothetical protein
LFVSVMKHQIGTNVTVERGYSGQYLRTVHTSTLSQDQCL